ncbi:MAG: family 43 glycosylhydrolase [Verrucomicrobia bacterium]|nr:family 43 glycosylhydrolase [Verrucomicrobiota bacterium]
MKKSLVPPQRVRIFRYLLSLLVAQALFCVPGRCDDRLPVYRNPLVLNLPSGGHAESCPDPAIIHSQTPGDPYWYLYATSDPLNSDDRDAQGHLIIHLITHYRSLDLIHWEYLGAAFSAPPAYGKSDALLWGPNIVYHNGQYYLYFTVTDTTFPGGGSAIGVATSASAGGPWTYSNQPVVAPEPGLGTQGAPRWAYDPKVLDCSDGRRLLYFGSYFGGISARELSPDGLSSDSASETQITIPNRYEASEVVQHDGYYYLLVSATNCCNGPLTGYSIFAGRSRNPLGPFIDRVGNSLLDDLVGGTPVISMNGNRWVGPGHCHVINDFAGKDWLVYHAVDQTDPFFIHVNPDGTAGVDFTKRPALIDRLDWVDGWPSVRSGFWASNEDQVAPVAQPNNQHLELPILPFPEWVDYPGQTLIYDHFNGNQLSPAWSWVRQPAPASYAVVNNTFTMATQAADLYVDTNNASVLKRQLPPGDLVIETAVEINVPNDGKVYNYVQAGCLVYLDDDNYIKLGRTSIWETRQTEFAKELKPVPAGYPRYGNTVVGPPGANRTFVRIIRRVRTNGETYTAYTSNDGVHWVRGGTWDHQLGNQAELGLFAMGGAGFVATFDYIRVSRPLLTNPE